eukprot:ANDGO_04414.mRNA.1 hypothetical protein
MESVEITLREAEVVHDSLKRMNAILDRISKDVSNANSQLSECLQTQSHLNSAATPFKASFEYSRLHQFQSLPQ